MDISNSNKDMYFFCFWIVGLLALALKASMRTGRHSSWWPWWRWSWWSRWPWWRWPRWRRSNWVEDQSLFQEHVFLQSRCTASPLSPHRNLHFLRRWQCIKEPPISDHDIALHPRRHHFQCFSFVFLRLPVFLTICVSDLCFWEYLCFCNSSSSLLISACDGCAHLEVLFVC